MITIAVCLIAGIIIMIIREQRYGLPDFVEYIMLGLMGGIAGFAVGALLALALPMKTQVSAYENEIVALQDNLGTSGSFFLGSGNIDGSIKYVFYYKAEGSFRMAQVDYKDAVIKYSDEAKVIRYKEEPIGAFINLFALDIPSRDEYEIYVPKGTIKNDYNLDAQ